MARNDRFGRWWRAVAAGVLAIASLQVFAQVSSVAVQTSSVAGQTDAGPMTPAGKPLAFTIVSIKPHGNARGNSCAGDACHFSGVTIAPILREITQAQDLEASHGGTPSTSNAIVTGGPSWLADDRWDIDAKIDPADLPAKPLTFRQLYFMLEPVIIDRFQLRFHHETRSFPAYDLVMVKGGSKLKPAIPAPGAPAGQCQRIQQSNGVISAHNCVMGSFVAFLTDPNGRRVVDKTGLSGQYDFDLHWTPDETPDGSPLAGGPSLTTAVQDQLGLKLEPSSTTLDVLVIDSAKKPTPN